MDTKELHRKIIVLEKALRQKEITEEALPASEKRYRRLFESARDGILIRDAETGKVVDVNPSLRGLSTFPMMIFGANVFGKSVPIKDISSSKEAFRDLQTLKELSPCTEK